MSRLPRKVKADVANCHLCRQVQRLSECTSMSPSATPAAQTAAASTESIGTQARHQSQPSAISATHSTQNAFHAECTSMSTGATPATQSEGPRRQAPNLPGRMHVDVAKCHACHTNSRGVHGVNWDPSVPP